MRDVVEGILMGVLIVGYVDGRSKLWSIFLPNEDDVPWMGPKKIQTLFGDDPNKKQ
jgi:hypothetical protein